MNQADVKNAKPGTTVRDDQVRGLMLRVFDQRRSFYLNFRTKTKVERKPKLGDWPTMTLDQARKIARDMLFEVARGGDPIADRNAAIAAPTVADLWTRYWTEHGSKKKSKKDDQRIYDNNFPDVLKATRVAELTYDEAYALHAYITPRAPIQANRTLALFSKMLALSERFGWRKTGSNPCQHVARNPETKRKRYMSAAEAVVIARLLREAQKDQPAAVAFIYLLIYTGARCGDIVSARWSELDGNVLRLSDGKTGARAVQLPQAPLDVLATLPRTSGTLTGIGPPTKLWNRIRREAGCPDLRLHDLRHSFASAALSAGLSLAQIGELLGHKTAETTKRYAHLMEEPAAAAAAATVDIIQQRMTGPVTQPQAA